MDTRMKWAKNCRSEDVITESNDRLITPALIDSHRQAQSSDNIAIQEESMPLLIDEEFLLECNLDTPLDIFPIPLETDQTIDIPIILENVSDGPNFAHPTSVSNNLSPAIDPISNLDLSQIIVPPSMKRRGRPKGCDKTVIGLPKKSKTSLSAKARPFCKRTMGEKALVTLRWLVREQVAIAAINRGVPIEKKDVEYRSDDISHALVDDDVNIITIKKYFSDDAWALVCQVYDSKKKSVYLCGKCIVDLNETADNSSIFSQNSTTGEKLSIRCDYCLTWYHLACVKLKKPPKAKHWQCSYCKLSH